MTEPAGLPPMARTVIVTVIAIAAVAIIVPLGQYLYGLAATAPWLAAISPATGEALITLLIFGTLLGVAIIGRALDKERSPLLGPTPLAMAGTGLAIGAGGMTAAYTLAVIADATSAGDGVATAILLGTLTVLVQASVEEIYFRGWLQPVIVRAVSPAGGIAIVALIFAALHLAGGERSPVSLVNLCLGGVLFGLLALRSGGLALPIAAHVAWNWTEVIALGLDPNPGVGSFGAIIDRDIVGSAMWGGSAEGLNASIGVTFVLAALIVPALVWRSRWSADRLTPASTTPAASPG